MKKLMLSLTIVCWCMLTAYCQDQSQKLQPKKVEISEGQLRNCLEYRELYLDQKMKAAQATAGMISSDSTTAIHKKNYEVAKAKLQNARSENWIWRGLMAAAVLTAYFSR